MCAGAHACTEAKEPPQVSFLRCYPLFSFLFLFHFLKKLHCMSVPACMHVCAPRAGLVPGKVRRQGQVGSPGTEVTDDCEPPCGC